MNWALTLIIASVALAACGFQPLYGNQETQGVSGKLLQEPNVFVGIIREREGQILRNFLIDELGQGKKSAHSLVATVSISEQDLGENSEADTTRSRVVVTGNFHLKIADQTFPFQTRSAASFSTVQSDYATLVAREDAIRRGLKDVANQAALRIVSIFNRTAPQ